MKKDKPHGNGHGILKGILMLLLVCSGTIGSMIYLLAEPVVVQITLPGSEQETKGPETQAQTETQAPQTQTETQAPQTQTETQTPQTQPETQTQTQSETQPAVRKPETEPAVTIPETDANSYAEGIHKYTYQKNDCTWNDAFNGAKNVTDNQGNPGHLLTIETREELDFLMSSLSTENPPVKEYYISAARSEDGKEYYWIGRNGESYGSCINAPGSIYEDYWYPGEPSFNDLDGTIEDRLALMFVRNEDTGIGKWYLNDCSGTELKNISGYAGKIGYLVEWE